jgi:hypothetical protein
MENTSVFQASSIAPAEFDMEMIKSIHLGADPVATAARYGLVYEQIRELPHFIKRMEQVEQALLIDGSLTSVIAGAGLHAAVEKLAFRVADDRIPTGDLVKAIEVFKKVKDGSKANEPQGVSSGVSLVINIPAMGTTPAKTIEVTTEPNKKLQEYNTIEAEVVAIEEHTHTAEKPESFEINI